MLLKFLFTLTTCIQISFTFPAMAQQPGKISFNKIGPGYVIKPPGKEWLLFVSGQQPNNQYQLHLLDVQTNDIIKSRSLGSFTKQMEAGQVIGLLGNIFWVLTDSLQGYDATTLKVASTESSLVVANPFMKDNFSRQANSYLLDEAAQVMYITGANGDRYKLYPSGTIIPDNNNNEAAPGDYNYEMAANYRLYNRYELKSALSCVDTFKNMLYILGSEKETGYVLSYFGSEIYPANKETRQLTILPFRPHGVKAGNVKDASTGKEKYHQGGFLNNKFTANAWHGAGGEKIIIHINKKTSTLAVAATDINGAEKWNIDSETAQDLFSDYFITSSRLIIGFKNPASKPGNTLINIDLNTGKLIRK